MPGFTINTDCSGMEAPIQALRNLGVEHEHGFSCDVDRHARATIMANFPPKVMYEDITTRDNKKALAGDVYVAGFPCQPFSSAGLQQGFEDRRGRGKIFFDVLDYIRQKKPKLFILENVSGLVRIEGGRYFASILEALASLGAYNVVHSVLDTKHHGVPQSRRRIYILGFRRDVDRGTFTFPEKVPMPSIELFLEPRDPKLATTGLPPAKQTTALGNVRSALRVLQATGCDPFRQPYVVDIDSSAPRSTWRLGYSPCLTCSRRSGHWLTNRGRRTTKFEQLRLQGMNPLTLKQAVSDPQLTKQVGNAMSVNVLERLFVRALPACGLAPAGLPDRWADGTAVRALWSGPGKSLEAPLLRRSPKGTAAAGKAKVARAAKPSGQPAKRRHDGAKVATAAKRRRAA